MKSNAAVFVVLVVILGLLLPAEALAVFDVPDDFQDVEVADELGRPTAFDWLPDGDLLIAAQDGTLFRQSGTGSAEPILDLNDTTCLGNETGLLGLAVDPDFQDGDRFVYLYYTDRKGNGNCANPANRANRVSRFRMNDQDNLVDEQILIDNIPARGGNHNGGDLQFDRNGLLYISVGDAGQDLRTGEMQNLNGNARRLDLLAGKILRIQGDGGIPAGNPLTGSGTRRCSGAPVLESAGKRVEAEKKNRRHKKKKRRRQRRRNRPGPICQEIFATGLRNPFRIAFDPNDTNGAQRFFINDVGGSAWEEVNESQEGTDYGWNVREGPCLVGSVSNCPPDNQFERPRFAYRLMNPPPAFSGCRTITGGAFVPDEANWPAEFNGVYLFADLQCDKIFELRDETPGDVPDIFATGTDQAGAVHLAFGPDDALYYSTFDAGGQVRRIVHSP